MLVVYNAALTLSNQSNCLLTFASLTARFAYTAPFGHGVCFPFFYCYLYSYKPPTPTITTEHYKPTITIYTREKNREIEFYASFLMRLLDPKTIFACLEKTREPC